MPAPPSDPRTDRGQFPLNGPRGLHVDAAVGEGQPSAENIGGTVDETLAALREGRNPPNLEVDTPAQLRAIWDRLSADGTPIAASGYPGEFEQLADGTKIGYRAASKSGGATIDVFRPDGTHVKVHLP